MAPHHSPLLLSQGTKHSFEAFRDELASCFELSLLPVERRPLWQIQHRPKECGVFMQGLDDEVRRGELDSVHYHRIKQLIAANTEPPWSLHIDAYKTVDAVMAQGLKSVFGPDVCGEWIDVEDLTEACLGRLHRFCRRVTPFYSLHAGYPSSAHDAKDDWYAGFIALHEQLNLIYSSHALQDQWIAPPHEVSDLLNRHLYPERVVVFLNRGDIGMLLATKPERVRSILNTVRSIEQGAGIELRQLQHEVLGIYEVECYRIRGLRNDFIEESASVYIPALRHCEASDAARDLACAPRYANLPEGADRLATFVHDFGGEFHDVGESDTLPAVRFRTPSADKPDATESPWEMTPCGNLKICSAQWPLAENPSDFEFRALTSRLAELLIKGRKPGGKVSFNELTSLDDDTAKVLASYRGQVVVPQHLGNLIAKFRVLRLEDARRFVDGGLTSLNWFQLIEADAALLLAEQPHLPRLELDGLIRLSPETASILVAAGAAGESTRRHAQSLSLSGLFELSPEVAAVLGEHHGWLDLSGLKELSRAAAKGLSKHQGRLQLDGLTSLNARVATELAKAPGYLGLSGLRTLSPATAAALGRSGCGLGLNGLSELTASIANLLVTRPPRLSLNGLRRLKPEVAKVLAKHRGELSLNGLAHIPEFSLQWLSRHKDDLSLDGLQALSLSGARWICQHEGTLSLQGVIEIGDRLAELLSRHCGTLYVNPKVYTYASAERLVACGAHCSEGEDELWKPETEAERDEWDD